MALGFGDFESFGYETAALEAGTAAGVQHVGPIGLRVDTLRRRCRLTVVVSGGALAANVTDVGLEACLTRDGATWYPVADAVTVPAGATVVKVHDGDVVGLRVRIAIRTKRRTTAAVHVELAQA